MIKSIVGPMFAGKSNVLINHYMNIWNKKSVKCFKPLLDTRDNCVIKSRNLNMDIPAIGIDKFEDMLLHIDSSTKTIFIDEAQFIDGNYQVLSDISVELDIDIYVSGLNMTYQQKPFGSMPQIMAMSQDIEFVNAVCNDCNKPAPYVYNVDEFDGDILVGDSGYMSLCRNCLYKRKNTRNLSLIKKSID